MKKTKPKVNKFFEGLKAGFEDIIAYKQGKIALKTSTYEVPDKPVRKARVKSTAAKKRSSASLRSVSSTIKKAIFKKRSVKPQAAVLYASPKSKRPKMS